jgi:hypothetical protein
VGLATACSGDAPAPRPPSPSAQSSSVEEEEFPPVGPPDLVLHSGEIEHLPSDDPYVTGLLAYTEGLVAEFRPGSTMGDVLAAYRGRKDAFQACSFTSAPSEIALVIYVDGTIVVPGMPSQDLLMSVITPSGGGFKHLNARPGLVEDPMAWCRGA